MIQIKDPNRTRVRSPFVYAFAGGSGWAKQNNYFQVGLSAIIMTYEYTETEDYLPPPTIAAAIGRALAKALMRTFPIFNISAQTGLFYSGGYTAKNGSSVKPDVGVYLTLRLGMGAAF